MSADLKVINTDNAASVVPGTVDTYTITVTNNGPDTVSSVTLTDTIPPPC
jgi:trimeric autotransporter adhesin